MKLVHIAIMAAVLASFAISLYFYEQMPDKVATHWGLSGKADGYSGKVFGSFFVPVLLVIMSVLLYYIPFIDPLRANVAKFREHFDRFILVFALFMLYVHILSIYWNLGNEFDFGQFMLPGFAALFIEVGSLIGHAKRNWFIGIRTPWTLSSERVWDKTHKVGGDLFKATGILSLLGVFFPQIGFIVIIGMALAIAAWSLVFSYVEFRKEQKTKRK